ncbi:MAG: hypothetical protein HZA90_18485 [Verrucomicrobia bacterium]|nr:hypothetical protein [Verrucomicrobiota bacterium]
MKTKFFKVLGVICLILSVCGVSSQAQISPGNLTLWLKADAGVTKDTNDLVSRWEDQSPRSNHLTQATAAWQPLWASNALHGLPVLQFRDDWLARAAVWGANLFASKAATVFLVQKQLGSDPRTTTLAWRGIDEQRLYVHATYDNLISFQVGHPSLGGAVEVPQPANWDDTWHMLSCRRDTTNGQLRVDGLAISSNLLFATDAYLVQTGDLVVGSDHFGNTFNGDIAEVIVYAGTLSDTERAAVEIYLLNKWNLLTAPAAVPDLLIKTAAEADSAYASNGVFQFTPAWSQIKTQSVAVLRTAAFQVKAENDGLQTQPITLKAVESAASGWAVTYRLGASDITPQIVTAGGFTTVNLSPGGNVVVTVEIAMTGVVPAGTNKTVTIFAYDGYVTNLVRDAVQAVAVAVPGVQPDLLVRRAIDPTPLGDNIYNSTGTGQTSWQQVFTNQPARYLVTLANDGNTNMSVLLNAQNYDANWPSTLELRELAFDGGDDYVDLGAWSTGSNWTVEAWVRPTSIPAGRRVIAGGMDECLDWSLAMHDGQFAVETKNPGGCTLAYRSGVAVTVSNWYHLAATCDGTNSTLYVHGPLLPGGQLAVDSPLVVSGPVEPNYVGTAGGVRIGSAVCCGGDSFPGAIRDVRIWNHALSSNEVRTGVIYSRTGTEPGLMGLWLLDEGAGGRAYDLTANRRHGTLMNDPKWQRWEWPWAGGVTNFLLAPGAGKEFTVQVTPQASVAAGAVKELLVTATAAGKSDAVRLVTTALHFSTTPVSALFTSTADFGQGRFNGTDAQTVTDQLQMATNASTFPFLWVPNSGDSTVSKVDTRTGQEVGRYRVTPASVGGNPSRTTVDLRGNCWVANRSCSTAVKIGLLENGEFHDRNGDGVAQTSTDRNGDGQITGAEMLEWGQDECVLHEIFLTPGHETNYVPGAYLGAYLNNYWNPGLRGLAVDAQGNLWAGTHDTMAYFHIDGASGRIVRKIDVSSVSHTAYGAVIDERGILWSSGYTEGNPQTLLRLNTADGTFSTNSLDFHSYGLGLDRNNHLFVSAYQEGRLTRWNVLTGTMDWSVSGGAYYTGVAVTDDGDVWVVSTTQSTVTRFSNHGVQKSDIPVGPTPTGTAVDAAGKVWVMGTGDEYLRRIDPATDSVDLVKRIASTHDGFSDMTGILVRNSTVRFGLWSCVHDGHVTNTAWTSVSWHGSDPTGTNLLVRVRSSNNQASWSVWEDASDGAPLQATPPGRYLEFEVTLRSLPGAPAPILYDLSASGLTPGDAELGVMLSATPNPVLSEYAQSYFVTLTNASTNWASGVIVSNLISTNFDFLSLSVPGGSCQRFAAGFCSDFASGLGRGAALYGNATVADDGTGSNPCLHLTDAANWTQGSFVVDLGAPVPAFKVTCRLLMGDSTSGQADGTSFCFGNDVGGSFGESGSGSGLIVAFDTYEWSYRGVRLLWAGQEFARTPFTSAQSSNIFNQPAQWSDVSIEMTAEGLVTVKLAGETLHDQVPIPNYTPLTGRAKFGFGGRCGGENQKNWIDDVCFNGDTVLFQPVVCQVGGVGPRSAVTLVFSLLPLSPGVFTNAATVTANEADPLLANNSNSLALTVQPVPCAAPPVGFVAWWPGESNALDFVGTNHLTMQGGLFSLPGKSGSAFTFDSDDDRLSAPHHDAFNPSRSGFSVQFWMQGDKSQPGQSDALCTLIEKSHGWADKTGWAFQAFPASGVLSFGCGYGGGAGNGFLGANSLIDVLDSRWHHVVGTWDGFALRLYVDGALQATTPLLIAALNTRPLNLGFAWGNGYPCRFFRGQMDEVAIHNRALDVSEVASLYAARSGGMCRTPPVIIQPAQLLDGIVGRSYSQTLSAMGGTPPYSYRIVSGSLPSGLIADVLSGELWGTPNTAGTFVFTIRARDSQSVEGERAFTNNIAACTPRPAGLIGWWTADSGADDLAGINHGTLEYNAGYDAGHVGRAFVLDGTDDAIRLFGSSVGALDITTNRLSVGAWINLAATNPPSTGYQCIFDKAWDGSPNGYELAMVQGKLQFWLATTAATRGFALTNVDFPLQRWVHVMGTYDGSMVRLYVNGVEQAAAPLTGNILHNTHDACIGNDNWPGSRNYGVNGLLDEVSVFNRALSASEVAALFLAGAAGQCLPLQADLLVKNATEPDTAYRGDSVYQTVPDAPQVKAQSVFPQATVTYQIKVQNDGPNTRTFTLKPVESSDQDWLVVYRTGDQNISLQMRSAAGFTTASLAPGAAQVLDVEMTPGLSVPALTTKSVTVNAFLDSAAVTVRDAVRLVSTCGFTYQPDLTVRRAEDGNFAGEGFFNTTGLGQTKFLEVTAGQTATYYVQLRNHGNTTNRIALTGEGSGGGWTVNYSGDLAPFVATGSGGTDIVLPPKATSDLLVQITPDLTVLAGAAKELTLTATSLIDPAKSDIVQAVTTVLTPSTTPEGGTYTSSRDFEKGRLSGVECLSVPDQLQLSTNSAALPFLWAPNCEGTISKLDTLTGQELARYRTCPPSVNGQPSRTTVDLMGNCWVANRYAGTAVKVGLLEKGQYLDRNGNGLIETSTDLNGDGDITGDELLPWGQDECVLFEVSLIPGYEGTFTPGTFTGPYQDSWGYPGPRGIAVDAQGNCWIGTYDTMKFYFLNGTTGQILRTINVSSVSHTSYGAVMDRNGIVWSSGNDKHHVLRLDPATGLFTTVNVGHHIYGINVDRHDHLFVTGWQQSKLSRLNIASASVDWTAPGIYESRGIAVTDDGDIWTANSYPGTVTRWSVDGALKATIAAGSQPTGVAVDSRGMVWVVGLGDEYARRIDPTRNVVDFAKRILAGHNNGYHYGYSDMTGTVSRNATTRIGFWTVTHNAKVRNAPWGTVSWQAFVPEGTSLRVRVRSSNDQKTWSLWEAVQNGAALHSTPPGQFLEVEVALQSSSPGVTPVLYSLTVQPALQANYGVLVYTNNFETAVGPEWSIPARDVTPLGSRHFLGQFGNQTVTLTLNNLPPHAAATVVFDQFVIRSWDGNNFSDGPDLFEFNVAGGLKPLHATFNNGPANSAADGQSFPDAHPSATNAPFSGAAETNSIGFSLLGGGVMDSVYQHLHSFPHTANSLVLNFTAAGLSPNLSEESWGLDNVRVYLTPNEGPPRLVPVAWDTSGFVFNLLAEPGWNYVIQASSNLLNWAGLSTNRLNTNLVRFVDPPAPSRDWRFYRAVRQP